MPKTDLKATAANMRRYIAMLTEKLATKEDECKLAENYRDVAYAERESLKAGRDKMLGDTIQLRAELSAAKRDLKKQRGIVKRLRAELAALKRATTMMTHSAPVEQLPDFDVWVANAAPDIVVCSVASVTEPHYWHRIVREGGEDTRATVVTDNTPAEVQVPPFGAGMPGATLTPREVFNPRVAWSWLYWDWRRSPLTCPAVSDSPEGRASVCDDGHIDNYYTTYTNRDGKANPVCVSEIYRVYAVQFYVLSDALFYPLPPATWRAA